VSRRGRYRLGPSSSSSGWSPQLQSSSRDDDAEFWDGREVDALERMLGERGEMGRRELCKALNCRRWGPGRFGAALRRAVEQGRIRRTGLGRYGPMQ
jgi:hypothetical protein